MVQCKTCLARKCNYPDTVIERGMCSNYEQCSVKRFKSFEQKHPKFDKHFTDRYSVPKDPIDI